MAAMNKKRSIAQSSPVFFRFVISSLEYRDGLDSKIN